MTQSNPDDPKQPTIGVGVVILRPAPAGPEVLLILRARAPHQGEWSIPGGRQHWGETLHDAARREVLEETGVTVGELTLVDVVDELIRTPDGHVDRHMSLIDYLASWISGEPRAGDDAADVRWVPAADIGRLIAWDETQRVIRKAAEAFKFPN
jgi:8-oxo-dGTP diphosphatase